MEHICQSCGMEMTVEEEFGTNNDGTLNQEYCIYCFKDGDFTEDCTMEDMINSNLEFLEEFNKDSKTKLTEEDARKEMLEYFPTLKRWQKEN